MNQDSSKVLNQLPSKLLFLMQLQCQSSLGSSAKLWDLLLNFLKRAAAQKFKILKRHIDNY